MFVIFNFTKFSEDGKNFILSNYNTGAVSRLTRDETVLFTLFDFNDSGRKRAADYLLGLDYPENEVSIILKKFEAKIIKDGWTREAFPESAGKPAEAVYFNITSDCNLSCAYCYKGSIKRNEYMNPDDTIMFLNCIEKVNPDCNIIITGGEPFLHPDIFTILDLIKKRGFKCSILTNATLIDEDCTEKLKTYDNLSNIQVSIDGITEATHKMTRGNSFTKTIKGIEAIIKSNLNYSLAPTIHDKNLSEIYDIAHFAFSNNGGFTPNNLRNFPGTNNNNFSLSNSNLTSILEEVECKLIEEFGEDYYQFRKRGFIVKDCDRNNFICGMAHSLFEIDFNGDVYPCHLLHTNELKLGNLLVESLEDIIERVEQSGLRKFTYEIEKCSKCHFMSTCGGGCKAGAYYESGRLDAIDPLCEVLYDNQLKVLN